MAYLSDSKLDKAYEPHVITHKLETECSTYDSKIATVETILSKSSCLVTIITSEISEQKFKIFLKSESKTYAGTYNKEKELEIMVHSGDILNLEDFGEEKIFIYPNRRTLTIKLREPHLVDNLEITTPNPKLLILEKEDDNSIRITVPDSIKDDFDSTITVRDSSIDETQKIRVVFSMKLGFFSSLSAWDIVLFLLFLIVLFIIYLWYLGDDEKSSQSKRSYMSKPPGGSQSLLRMNQQ